MCHVYVFVGVQTQRKQYSDCAIQCSLLPAPPLNSSVEIKDELGTEGEIESDSSVFSSNYSPVGEASESDMYGCLYDLFCSLLQ